MARILESLSIAVLAVALLPGLPVAAQEASPPPLDSIDVGRHVRTYALYTPAMTPPSPAVLLVLHGNPGDGALIRGLTGKAVERLADRHGFLVVYPDGFERGWNGCREGAPYAANVQGIDDVAFLRALVDRLEAERGVDPSRVWTFGFSNGGHMAIRLALEAPDEFPAVAVVAASLPTADALDCNPSGRPASVLIVNGTADPINPFDGGEVRTESAGRIGVVRSSRESALYFAELIEAPNEPETKILLSDSRGEPVVERARWHGEEGREVVLVTVHGGDHSIPGSSTPSSEEAGAVELDAALAAVEFFRRVTGGSGSR